MTPKNSSFSSASRVKSRVGQRHQRVEADREQRLDLAAVDRLHDLDAPMSPARGISSGAMPQTRATCSRAAGSVIERWPGQLIALLPVLAAALAVALAGDHHAARALAADVAGGQAEVDHRQAVLDALRLMLDAARVQRHRAVGLAEPARRLLDRLGRHAGDLARRARGSHALHRRRDRVEAGGVRVDERRGPRGRRAG